MRAARLQHCDTCTPTFVNIEAGYIFPESSMMQSAQESWNPGSCRELSRMCSLSQVSLKRRAAGLQKSEFIGLKRSNSSSLLFARDPTFTRCTEGSLVRNPRCLNSMNAPVHSPVLQQIP